MTQTVRAGGVPGKVSMSSGGYLDKVGLEQDPKIRAFGRYGIRRRKLKAENTE